MNGLKLSISQYFINVILLFLIGLIFFIIANIVSKSFSNISMDYFMIHLSSLYISTHITIINNILATILSILMSFFIAHYLYSASNNRSSFVIVLISFPHVSYCLGIAYLFASSGLFARLSALINGNEIPYPGVINDSIANCIYIFSLAIRETPFLVLISFSIFEKINIKNIHRQVTVLGLPYTAYIFNCIFPLWLKSMVLPMLIVLTFSFSNFEFSSILGPQFPSMINVQVIQSWYATNSFLINQLATLIIALIFSSFFSILLLILLGLLLIFICKNIRMSSNKKFFLIGRSLLFILIISFGLILLITLLLSLSKGWFFPMIIPTSFTISAFTYIFNNYLIIFISTVITCAMISLFALILVIYLLEVSKNRVVSKILIITLCIFILLIPQNLMLIGLNDLRNSYTFIPIKSWYYFSILLYVLPYVYLMSRQIYEDFNFQFTRNGDILGKSKMTNFFKIKLPIISQDILLIFAIGFSVCFYQFLQSIIISQSQDKLFNYEVYVLFHGESVNIASAGSLINFLPCLIILFMIWLRGLNARV